MFSFVNQKPCDTVVKTVQGDVNFDVLQKARKDLIGEIEAIMEYDSHIHTSTNSQAIKTWEHIKKEELHHVGELLGLLKYLDASQVPEVLLGFQEFDEILEK